MVKSVFSIREIQFIMLGLDGKICRKTLYRRQPWFPVESLLYKPIHWNSNFQSRKQTNTSRSPFIWWILVVNPPFVSISYVFSPAFFIQPIDIPRWNWGFQTGHCFVCTSVSIGSRALQNTVVDLWLKYCLNHLQDGAPQWCERWFINHYYSH